MSDVYARLAAMLDGGTGRQGAFAPGGWLFGDVLEAGHGELRLACGGLSLTHFYLICMHIVISYAQA